MAATASSVAPLRHPRKSRNAAVPLGRSVYCNIARLPADCCLPILFLQSGRGWGIHQFKSVGPFTFADGGWGTPIDISIGNGHNERRRSGGKKKQNKKVLLNGVDVDGHRVWVTNGLEPILQSLCLSVVPYVTARAVRCVRGVSPSKSPDLAPARSHGGVRHDHC